MAMATSSPSSQIRHPPSLTSSSSPSAIRLWPPNPATRSTLVQRLADHLSSVSFFSQRYGRISPSEASQHAARIEQDAFESAVLHSQTESSDIAVVQFYAKESSRLMLEILRKGPNGAKSASPAPAPINTDFDISDGNREFLTKEAAAELLKPLSVPGNTYSSICLSNRSFGEDAAKVAATILENLCPQLFKVNLADIVAGRNEDEALAVMSIFSKALMTSKLKYLNLSDNALGEKGVRAFSELLKSQNALEELYFMNNGISEEAAAAICELLPSASKLRVLHFHNNMTGDEGAVSLSQLVKAATLLEDFRCSSTRVATDGGLALAESLLSGSSLRKLDLRDNPFGAEVGPALAKPLKHHLGLKEVYLSYLGFEDEGIEPVLEALQSAAPGLEVLELAGNDLTDASAKKLASLLEGKSHLVKVSLSENELGDKGVVTVCNSLLNGHAFLAELDFCETNIGRIGACAAAKAVSNKPAFKLLALNGNHITDAGIEALKAALSEGIHGISVLGSLDDNEEEELSDDGGDEDGNDSDVDRDLQAQFDSVKM